MSDFVTSVIRTIVPTVVGALLAWLVTRGVTVDPATETQLTAALVALLTSVYYALARWAEARWPQVGWLLGIPRTPTYDKED